MWGQWASIFTLVFLSSGWGFLNIQKISSKFNQNGWFLDALRLPFGDTSSLDFSRKMVASSTRAGMVLWGKLLLSDLHQKYSNSEIFPSYYSKNTFYLKMGQKGLFRVDKLWVWDRGTLSKKLVFLTAVVWKLSVTGVYVFASCVFHCVDSSPCMGVH
jgi:hypothetical protein